MAATSAALSFLGCEHDDEPERVGAVRGRRKAATTKKPRSQPLADDHPGTVVTEVPGRPEQPPSSSATPFRGRRCSLFCSDPSAPSRRTLFALSLESCQGSDHPVAGRWN